MPGQLRLHLLNHLVGRVMVPLHVRLAGTQLLAGIKLDNLAASLRGLLNRLEDAESIEGVCLAAQRKTAGLEFVGNFFGGNSRGREDSRQCGAKFKRK